jgi:hypothetical protein
VFNYQESTCCYRVQQTFAHTHPLPRVLHTVTLVSACTHAQGESKKAKLVAWGVYHLDLDELNTRTETLNMYHGAVDLSLKK